MGKQSFIFLFSLLIAVPASAAVSSATTPSLTSHPIVDLSPTPPVPEWVLHARRLIGEADEVRNKALTALSAIPDFDVELKSAMEGPYRFYALDVVAALNRPEWIDWLRSRVLSDEDGFTTLTLNAMMTNENKQKIIDDYLTLLHTESSRRLLSSPTLCAILDTLGRLGYRFDINVLPDFMQHASYEVRQSTVSYARIMALKYKKDDYMKKVKTLRSRQPYQVRLQILFSLAEAKDADSVRLCRKDRSEQVKKACEAIEDTIGRAARRDRRTSVRRPASVTMIAKNSKSKKPATPMTEEERIKKEKAIIQKVLQKQNAGKAVNKTAKKSKVTKTAARSSVKASKKATVTKTTKQTTTKSNAKTAAKTKPVAKSTIKSSAKTVVRSEIKESMTTEKPLNACDQTYSDLYQDGKLDIAVAFGYKDARPFRFVADRYERMEFVEHLLSPCSEGHQLCEFTRSKTDFDVFTRKIEVPDQDDITVRIRVLNSSVGPDDEDNRNNPYQDWMSRHAEQSFLDAIKNSEVVLYNGHSRTGGGPDFRPPQILDNGQVDFSLYRRTKLGLKNMQAALSEKPEDSPLKLIGLFSCASDKHFVKAMRKYKSDLGLISSQSLLYHADAMENMKASIESILMRSCLKDFDRSLRAGDPHSGSRITGFFSTIKGKKQN